LGGYLNQPVLSKKTANLTRRRKSLSSAGFKATVHPHSAFDGSMLKRFQNTNHIQIAPHSSSLSGWNLRKDIGQKELKSPSLSETTDEIIEKR
jgi:hypothetical protein